MEGNGKSIHITGKKTDVSLDPVTGRLRISHSGVKWEWAADYEPAFAPRREIVCTFPMRWNRSISAGNRPGTGDRQPLQPLPGREGDLV